MGCGHELSVFNRFTSTKYPFPEGATLLKSDIHTDKAHLASLLADHHFDAHPEFQTLDNDANALWDQMITAYEREFDDLTLLCSDPYLFVLKCGRMCDKLPS